MRGISPVIATVIILAVTIAIAIAVVGWIMGIFRSSTKSNVQLELMPDSYINATGTTACLHIKNAGSAAAKITKISISGIKTYTNTSGVTIPGGKDIWLAIGSKSNCTEANNPQQFSPDPVNATPGVTYDVEIYTADGSVFPGTVTATS